MNIRKIKSYLTKIIQKPIVRNTLLMLLSNGLKLFVQAAYFVIIARSLGSEQYGAFVGIVALATLFLPFVNWGSGEIMIKHVSRNRALFSEYWGNTLFIILVFSLVLTTVLAFVAKSIIPIPVSPVTIILFLLAELLFKLIIDASGKAFMAVEMLHRTAQINILFSIKNLVGAVILVVFFPKATLTVWAILYFTSTLALALITCLMVNRFLESPRLALWRFKSEAMQGFYFSLDAAADNINQNIDKTLLTRLSTLEATGIYGAAYRLIDVAFVPIASLMAVTYAKFFQKGETGISGNIKFAIQLSLIAGLYGFLGSLCLFFFAPIVPYILGEEYVNVVEALHWLAPLLLIASLSFFAADTLTGAGFQGVRSAIQVTAAMLNLLLNFWLIPIYSWKGAAWSSLASDGLNMVGLWALVFILYRRELNRKAKLNLSNINNNSNIAVDLPATDYNQNTKSLLPSTKDNKKSYTIICVDDSPSVLNIIDSFLYNLDDALFSVILITDPLKALVEIIREKPDIILLDIGMPNLDGYQLCSLLRNHSDFQNTPVIMVTGRNGFIDQAKATAVGASGYLIKPFTQAELIKILFKNLR